MCNSKRGAHGVTRPTDERRTRLGQRTIQGFGVNNRFVSVAIANRKSKIKNLRAGVVQW